MFRHGALVTASTGVPAAKASARVFQQCCSWECPQTVVRCGRLLMLCSQAAHGTSASKEVMSDWDLLLAGSSTAQSLTRSSCLSMRMSLLAASSGPLMGGVIVCILWEMQKPPP